MRPRACLYHAARLQQMGLKGCNSAAQHGNLPLIYARGNRNDRG